MGEALHFMAPDFMRTRPNPETRFNLIVLFWSLLLVKCFTLEFLVRHYAVPVNSFIYVWTLTISMAAIATWVYADLHKTERNEFFQSPRFYRVLLSGLLSAGCVLFALATEGAPSAIALACAALILALKHTSLRMRLPARSSRLAVAGWLAMVPALAYMGAPMAFLAFALGLMALWTLPSFAQFLAFQQGRARTQ